MVRMQLQKEQNAWYVSHASSGHILFMNVHIVNNADQRILP